MICKLALIVKKIAMFGLSIASVGCSDAMASYSMFCDLNDRMVSTLAEKAPNSVP